MHERRRITPKKNAKNGIFFRNNARLPRFVDSDPNVYEEWERKFEQILFSCDLYETNIVRLMVLEFEGYALY